MEEIKLSFADASEEPIFQWETAQIAANPLAKFGLGRPNTLIIDPRFGDLLWTDPRRDRIVDIAPADAADPSEVTQYSFWQKM